MHVAARGGRVRQNQRRAPEEGLHHAARRRHALCPQNRPAGPMCVCVCVCVLER